jgi:uncharacterized membrane protein
MMLVWCLGLFFNCIIQIIPELVIIFPFVQKSYSIVCHQDPAKLILMDCGNSMVCARCSGIYISMLILSLINLFRQFNFTPTLKLLFLFSFPMLFDVLMTSFSVYNYSKLLAFVTGMLFGSILFFYLYNGLKFLLNEIQHRK